eukprot:s4750_g1.t1
MDESSSYAVKARTEMVHKALEGLRDEAFELARGGESMLSHDEDYDDTSYPAETEHDPHSYSAGEEDEEPSYEDFELDEDEATALNCLEELDPEEAESGHVIQLQLAANAGPRDAKAKDEEKASRRER